MLREYPLSQCINFTMWINSFPASSDLCRLLITFANSLDPDQARQNVRPDLDPNCLTLMVFLKEFFEKVILKKNPQPTKKHVKLPNMQRVKGAGYMPFCTKEATLVTLFAFQHTKTLLKWKLFEFASKGVNSFLWSRHLFQKGDDKKNIWQSVLPWHVSVLLKIT